ncbi:DUF2080 family transposase-associated protein [Candidatus Micrarchaeota archaeon]|nr:DUF2080 family transposase-associated protein [Candidatus Micrarchaeota archaeon]
MSRKVVLRDSVLTLTNNRIEGFLDRVVTRLGTSAKVDVPKRFLNRRVYVIVTKDVVKSDAD